MMGDAGLISSKYREFETTLVRHEAFFDQTPIKWAPKVATVNTRDNTAQGAFIRVVTLETGAPQMPARPFAGLGDIMSAPKPSDR